MPLTNSILVFGSYHTIFGSENSIGVCFHIVYYTTRWRLHSSNNGIVHFFQVKKNCPLISAFTSCLYLVFLYYKCQGTFPSGLRNIHKSRLQQSPNLVFVRPLTDAMIIPSPLHQLSFSLLVRVNYKPYKQPFMILMHAMWYRREGLVFFPFLGLNFSQTNEHLYDSPFLLFRLEVVGLISARGGSWE